MAKRAYDIERLFVYTDRAGRESWYGSWREGARRVQRKIGSRRPLGGTRGLTRVQAERTFGVFSPAMPDKRPAPEQAR